MSRHSAIEHGDLELPRYGRDGDAAPGYTERVDRGPITFESFAPNGERCEKKVKDDVARGLQARGVLIQYLGQIEGGYSGDSAAVVDAIEQWKQGVLQHLDSGPVPHWNYFHTDNWHKIEARFRRMRDKGQRPITSIAGDRIKIETKFRPYELVKDLKLDSPWKAGDSQLGAYSIAFTKLVHPKPSLDPSSGALEIASWALAITETVGKDGQNFLNRAKWYRIVAVLDWIEKDLTREMRRLETATYVERTQRFLELYPLDQVFEKMGVTRLSTSIKPRAALKKARRFFGDRGGSGEASNLANSLTQSSHARRFMNARQCQIYGL